METFHWIYSPGKVINNLGTIQNVPMDMSMGRPSAISAGTDSETDQMITQTSSPQVQTSANIHVRDTSTYIKVGDKTCATPERQNNIYRKRKRKQTHCPRVQSVNNEDLEFQEVKIPLSPSNKQGGYGETLPVTPKKKKVKQKGTIFPGGISPDERTPQKTEERKKSIASKMRTNRSDLYFTKEEEYDVHERAEAYVAAVMPDPQYYRFPSQPEEDDPKIENKENEPFIKDAVHSSDAGQNINSPTRKRRRSYGHSICRVTHRPDGRLHDMNDNSYLLPEGSRLFKPPNKLVELVAQAIADSPDGLLQVQQVYHALMNKYPYFRFMEKCSINSWRSSIRHALYQKWFRKMRFSAEFITSKGCYWALNPRHSPKEWTMPRSKNSRIAIIDGLYNIDFNFSQESDTEDSCSFIDDQALENMAAVASISEENIPNPKEKATLEPMDAEFTVSA
ncbi:uncharacterized protein LOC106173853 [Lingula anatina]|uniref:Uncharacterized protein LOC106173853 n=1 Tax=Lingula anatina TaxID=7574 RepID=A0A1S3JJN8_LINAN|nr:uncharacterized protein LOC106173853 [Lingula anatina]|eukprot:XP_013410597.1 uncharacterized protein LOC106173853 [Lingula anatina]